MEEIWKDIEGFEGAYQVSNFGRLKSFKRVKTGRVLSMVNKTGWYLNAVLEYNGLFKSIKIHSLVALYFLGDKPYDKPEVNHKDSNKQNNHVDNLEWISRRDNMKHAVAADPSFLNAMIYKNQHEKPFPVLQLSLNGDFINKYFNCFEASKATGVCARNIHQVASKTEYKHGLTRKQAGGFIWEFGEKEVS